MRTITSAQNVHSRLRSFNIPAYPCATHGHFTVVCHREWEIWTLPGLGEEFEPQLTSLSSGINEFYL